MGFGMILHRVPSFEVRRHFAYTTGGSTDADWQIVCDAARIQNTDWKLVLVTYIKTRLYSVWFLNG